MLKFDGDVLVKEIGKKKKQNSKAMTFQKKKKKWWWKRVLNSTRGPKRRLMSTFLSFKLMFIFVSHINLLYIPTPPLFILADKTTRKKRKI